MLLPAKTEARQLSEPIRRTHLYVLPPAYAAPIPQVADTLPQTPTGELSNSAAIPHPLQSLPHEKCAPDVHADLRAVIAAWPMLSEDMRATILRLIETGEVRA